MKQISILIFLSSLTVVLGFAETEFGKVHGFSNNRFDAIISSEAFLGKIGNSSRLAPQRLMNAFAVGALSGYRWNSWFIGIDWDFRLISQLDSLQNSGNTNWKASAFLLGLGVSYAVDSKWIIQAAIDIWGRYNFANKSDLNEAAYLSQPLLAKLKGQYFLFEKVPISLDGVIELFNFRQLVLQEKNYSEISNGFFLGVGITWHISRQTEPDGPESLPQKVSEPQIEPAPLIQAPQNIPAPEIPYETIKTQQQEALSKFVDVKKTEQGLMINLKGDVSFATGTSKLSATTKNVIKKAAEILSQQNIQQKIRVAGHTDSVGRKEKNLALSRARAESVKEELIKSGIKAENIKAEGFGADRPVSDNKSKEGRSQNRRVEIFIEE